MADKYDVFLEDLMKEKEDEEENYVDYLNRELYITDEIDESAVERYMTPIMMWNKLDNTNAIPIIERQPIKIYFCCRGGDVTIGLNLANLIACSKTEVIGINLAYCFSMGLIIFLGCHKRYGFSTGYFLQHDGSIGLENSSTKIKDVFEFITMQEKQVQDFILSRTKITPKQLKTNSTKEWFIGSEEAKELGIIDEILYEII